MTNTTTPRVLNTAQAAELLQFSEGTVIKYAADGSIPARKTRKGWRFREDLLLDWVAGHWEEGR